MLDEEAKRVSAEPFLYRLRRLTRSLAGVMFVIAAIMGAAASAYISGYNEQPRVVLHKAEADELRKTLKSAVENIHGAIGQEEFLKLPVEAQRKLVTAISYMESVSDRLQPQESDGPAIFFPKWTWLSSPAYAQDADAPSSAKEDFRQTLAMGILVAISVFWVVCLIVYFSSKDEKKIAFAANMIQTVLGFYIGVFTGLLGLAPVS